LFIARYRTKLKGMLASEKNRLHKTLDDAGVRLGNVVSDIGGVTSTEIELRLFCKFYFTS
jgi:hypothetical protein